MNRDAIAAIGGKGGEQFETGLRRWYGTSHSGQIWYCEMRNILDPEMVRYVNNVLAQPQ